MRIANGFFFGTCLLALQWTVSVKAFFNITSNILRTNQTFNLTVENSCNAAYTVDFGDGTSESLTISQKVVPHSYTSRGKYDIIVQSGSAPAGCKGATKSVEVRDPIQNLTSFVSSKLCRVGQTLNISVQVIPADTPVTVYWRFNKTTNWTQGPVECKEIGKNDVYVMVENGISVLSSECYDEILVVDFDFTSNPEIGAVNSPVEFTRTDVTGGNDTYTYIWEFNGNETINCANKTVTKFYNTSNPDPGHLVKLSVYNQEGDAAYLEKYIKIYEAVEPSIHVSYPNLTQTYGLTEFVVAPHKGHGVVYEWDYGDNSTAQNTTNRTISHMYSSNGEYCVLLMARNPFSEAILSFKISVVTPIGGFGFVKNIIPAETGFPTNIGIEIMNGSNVNVSVNFGDGSEPVWIVNVDDVLDIFVISLWHNYSTAGQYNVTIKAWNQLNTMTASNIAEVQNPVWNLTIQQNYDTKCLEVNGTLSVHLTVNGTDPQFFYDFGDQTNLTLNASIGNHSYITNGEYVLNITAFNKVSSVVKNSKVTVCKPVIPLVGLHVTASPTNLNDPVEFTMTLAEGSDFECLFSYGDGSFDFFGRNCYNLTYFADGVTTDKTRFINLEFKVHHNYSNVGRYGVYVNCSNRMSTINVTSTVVSQKPIEDLDLPNIPPKILGKNNTISWTMANGTNVTFNLEVEGTMISYSSIKTDTGDVFITNRNNIVSHGVYLVKLRAQNEVSEANRSIILIIQDDVTQVSFKTWTTTSDFGSNIPGFGTDNDTFPSEYPVNFTATPDKGTNLTYWWKFDDGDEKNTSESTITHKYAEIEDEHWTNVTVFNLVSSVTKLFRLKTEESVLGLTISDNSPVKVNRTTTFQLGFSRFGTRTCVKMDVGDGKGLFVFGGNHCLSHAPGYTHKSATDGVTSITHWYTYSTIDEFLVTVNATNTVSRLPLEYKSVTVALSCFYPNATMLGVGQNVTTATQKKRSEKITIKTDLEVDCEASKSTAFLWKIFKVSSDPVTFKALADEIPVPLAKDIRDQPELFIRETGLHFGFYKIVFIISMEDIEGVSGEAVGYIHVVPTDNSLQAFLDGGLRKRYKFGKNITVSAATSKDADFEFLHQAQPTFYWLCRDSSEPEFDTSGNLDAIPLISIPELDGDGIQNRSENLGGCFKTGMGRLNINRSVGYIDTRRGMTENSTYVLTLVLVTQNPFWSKRAVYSQELEITFGDPPEVEVTCSPSCPPKVNIDQKFPLQGTCKVCFGELTFEWQLHRHLEENLINPLDFSKMVEVKNLAEISTTPIDSLNLAIRQDSLKRETGYTAFFRAKRRNGQYGEYVHTFVTNSPPENGTCDVQPRVGSAMNTSFSINCTGWADPDPPLTYEFLYINYFQESVFFVSRDSSASVVLPMGHESNDFNLTLKMRIIDHLGAATIETIEVQVKPTDFSNEQLKDFITGEDGLLKEALKKGDLQGMVEIINSVGSIMNFNGRQDDSADQGNLTETEATEAKIAKDTRIELRTEIIKDLSEFHMSDVGHIKLLASAIDVTTEVHSEVKTKAQELAFHSFQKMATVLEAESQNNVGFSAVKDTVSSVLGGISNVAQSAASLAAVETTDSKENITSYTGNSSTGGVVSVKERARNRTLKLLNIVDDLGHIVLENVVAREPSVVVQTRDFNLTVQKTLLTNLGNSSITDEHTKFVLPSLKDMGMVYDDNGTQKYSSVEIQLTAVPTNLHTWSNTSKQVNSYSAGLTLKDKHQNHLDTSNFSSDADIYIPRNASQLPDEEEFYVVPMGEGKYIQYHTIEVNSSNYSVHCQIRPKNDSIENLTVLLSKKERPSPDKFDYNWTVPDFSGCSFSKVSRVVSNSSARGGASNATNSSTTNSTETEPEVVVIDVKRDCIRDPYIVSVSNSMVTEKGTYYLAVYHEDPEPETEEESPTSSSNEARKRRDTIDIPADCRAGNGRMKRSCVIIPPPPPKPTTPSKQQYGTKPSNVDFQGNTFNSNDTEHYMMRVFSSNCLYWDEKNENWINKGCKVGENTNPDLIHCKCNHLTSFASDFLVAPNPIDFDKVFSADLSKNPAVLIVVCLIFGLYLLLVVIARRYDNKDLDKLGATAVRNRAEATFSYLISIHTGVRQNAGTTSSVYIVISGDEWESTPIPLVDHDRKVFQRGQENNFVITLPRPLGNLTHIRIWHDNYGSNASWYLSRVSVDDLRTEERWYFICERWLAVEEDDGRVERILPVASEQELTHFQHLFVSKTVRELGDGHLWFSVVTRPATSPFTRVQRVSCCLSLLCCTMITNAMFYNLGGEGEKSTIIQIGSYEFDLRVFIIGIQSSLIVFPVNFAIVQIFRNVRPKEVRRERDIDTTEKQDEDFADISRCSSDETLQNASSEAQIIEKREETNSKKAPSIKQKKKKGLPHGFVYVAWVLCFLASVTSAAFTVFYSLQWGPEIANKWLIAFVTSFFQSILIIQPLKVVIAALLFAIIIKKPMDAGDETSDKKELKTSPDDRETGDDIILDYDENDERYRPPDEDFLKSARTQRLKEVRMSEILKEIAAYFLFLTLLLLVAYGNRDPNMYLLRKTLHETFVDLDQLSVDLGDATDLDLFWHWGRETLVPNLYPGVLYNNKSDKYTGFISDRYNYLVGISRLRQARVEKDSCEITGEFQRYFNDCYAEYSLMNEETEDYDIGWKFLNKSETTSRRRRSVEEQFAFRKRDENLKDFGDPFRIRSRRAIEPVYTSTSGRQQRRKKRPGNTAKNYYVLNSAILPDGSIVSCPSRWLHNDALKLRGYPFWGKMTLYNGGGYPADLGYDYPTALTVIADLHSHNWVDPQTRAVFVEFTVYNANTNLFGIAFLFVEFLPTGGAFPYAHFVVSRLYSYVGPFANFILACQVFLILFMLYFMYREGKAIYKQRKAYFNGFFNWMEIVMIVCEFAMVVLFLGRLWEVDKNLMELRYNPKDFVSFQYAGAADESLSFIMGILVFLVTLRFLKLFRFNKRMSLLGSTIRECAKPLGSFFICFMIVFLAYAILAMMVFGLDNDKYKNFVGTFETQTSILLGDFDYEELQRTNRLLGPIYFFTFMYFSVFYLLNMFMAIINDTFADVKSSNDKQQNEYEMVEFILSRFKENLGLNRNRIGTSKSPFKNSSSGFPSSPPFLPSDYKHREGDDLSECSQREDKPPPATGHNVLRMLSALNKRIDELTTFVEKNDVQEATSDQMLYDIIDKIQDDEDEVQSGSTIMVETRP